MICTNPGCDWPITLEADGSPPQFCSGCGVYLSLTIVTQIPAGDKCCSMCGKIKTKCKNGLNPVFCSRCGNYFSDDEQGEPWSLLKLFLGISLLSSTKPTRPSSKTSKKRH